MSVCIVILLLNCLYQPQSTETAEHTVDHNLHELTANGLFIPHSYMSVAELSMLLSCFGTSESELTVRMHSCGAVETQMIDARTIPA